jgi:hypothetical protein
MVSVSESKAQVIDTFDRYNRLLMIVTLDRDNK